MTHLSGYRIMWVMVLFDLPVTSPDERRNASKFRLFLKDQGFEMAQFSVYVRWTSGKEAVDAVAKRIEMAIPPGGKVDILQFTDAQYGKILSFRNRNRTRAYEKPEQLALF